MWKRAHTTIHFTSHLAFWKRNCAQVGTGVAVAKRRADPKNPANKFRPPNAGKSEERPALNSCPFPYHAHHHQSGGRVREGKG